MQRVLRKQLLGFVQHFIDGEHHVEILLHCGVVEALDERIDLEEQRALRVMQQMVFADGT